MKTLLTLLLLVLLTIPALSQQGADGLLIFAGDILTMAGDSPAYAEAVMIRDDRIVFVGRLKEAERYADTRTRRLDLRGRTLIPGFIDAHSHLLSYADTLGLADLHSPPVGTITSIAALKKALSEYSAREKKGAGSWIVGVGYDQDQLTEKRHPTAADLDSAFPNNPVILVHISGHMLIANSYAMRLAGISEKTPDPAGGRIIRRPGGTQPEGLIQEGAMAPFSALALSPPSIDIADAFIRRALQDYAAAGITTANEGLLSEPKLQLLESVAARKGLLLDLIALPAAAYAQKFIGTERIKWDKYESGLKFGGIKITVDGSPQGKTAFLSSPYLTAVPGCSSDCKGFANVPQDQLDALVLKAYRAGVRVFAHCNGDAAADMMLKAAASARKALNDSRAGEGTVIIHSQIVRPEQLVLYRKAGFIPSFFTNHTYFWGDVHRENLGEKRASFISPLNSALRNQLRFTNHADTPVTPISQMFIVWSSVNRISRTGKVIGAAERIDPYQALKAVTLNAAFQYGEQLEKGSIEVGKLADLVILDRNPLKVKPTELREIKVIETIKRGKTVYREGR